ncbi:MULTISPECIES: ATP-grasp domain-containing protein [Micromonospora]|uniref:ATP-grasp domain-containing protein n=1 Tax=Micromonospora solifontis TaxID=2487138 RepID=A0ABX9WFX5_9ACTN|nr:MULTISPECIES: ATP-grasp domain-containing protein [Micromonospora]NES16763.1 ATP-grasp domain-containing protein [Micromonospora sp. PPF5-17B]NES37746.1 ATP-grasp domain-containing protein [Micromonospora solifontis]NES58832.1 ATP-grasp domain-containing protein [Micromonospora sp. PPF5-6]RNL98011.1 ATP-grasp domain-containing protein [Micromonospora solifontis]
MVIAIVDGHATGRLLVERLRREGRRCVHVRSVPDLPQFFVRGFRPDDYEADLTYDGDLGELAARLKDFGVAQVLAGMESGVVLTDQLNNVLGTPGNQIETTHARRDKSAMAAVVRAAGLAVPRGRTFVSVDDAVDWYRTSRLGAAVVKPVQSGGTDNVRFCGTAEEVRAACGEVFRARNIFGEPNTGVLVQERVHGDEYYVNTVSRHGTHRVAEMWRYTKRMGSAGAPIYDYDEPVDQATPAAAAIRSYVGDVLTALGIVNGPAHTELILAGSQPVLIETGARLGGGTNPALVERIGGMSQTALLVTTLTDAAAFRAFDDRSGRWSQHLRHVELINRHGGVVRSLAWADRIRALPTVADLVTTVTPGSRLAETNDLTSSPGYLYLASADASALLDDYARIRAWEEEPFYTAAD